MSMQAQFAAQKKGAAQLIHSLYRTKGAEVAAILERELGEQVLFDHREIATSELESIWRSLPDIGSLVGSGTATDLQALKESSYAFRLMTLAQCLNHLPDESRPALLDHLDDFGLGIKEVEAYRADFVR